MPATNPPGTLVRTSHALTIRVNGECIGLINGWNPTISRTITPVYEIKRETSGDPVEKLPGNVTGQTIAIQRYDIYLTRMEQVFGTPDLMMLSLQQNPFTVQERWRFPVTDAVPGGTEIINYSGCWFSNIGRNYRSDGDRIVNVNATLEYTRRDIIEPST